MASAFRAVLILSTALIASGASSDFKLTTLVSFNERNGAGPFGGLIQDAGGNFYGTTSAGGKTNLGTVFKMTPNGRLTILASFNGTNGARPVSGLTWGPDGNLYGTTFYGGQGAAVANGGGILPNGFGTIFKITTNGELTTVVRFDLTNGSSPSGPLVLANDGNFYGTTTSGGTVNLPFDTLGTVFRMTPDGTLSSLVSFDGTNGVSPGNLIQGNDGNLYGTTSAGSFLSDGNISDSPGTVFEMKPDGTLTTLASFDSYGGGEFWGSRLVQTTDGTLYGTTMQSVFKITTNGVLSAVALLTSDIAPDQLMLGMDGYFYGTTDSGGSGNGIVFKMTTDGVGTTLVSFAGTREGAAPNSLMQGKNGCLYGTTSAFLRSPRLGTIFRLSTARPVINIISPKNNLRVSDPAVMIRGRAKGKDDVVKVLYQLNTNGWMEATSTNNWTNWTATVTLSPGLNVVEAYAASAASVSRTNRIRLLFGN